MEIIKRWAYAEIEGSGIRQTLYYFDRKHNVEYETSGDIYRGDLYDLFRIEGKNLVKSKESDLYKEEYKDSNFVVRVGDITDYDGETLTLVIDGPQSRYYSDEEIPYPDRKDLKKLKNFLYDYFFNLFKETEDWDYKDLSLKDYLSEQVEDDRIPTQHGSYVITDYSFGQIEPIYEEARDEAYYDVRR